MTDLEVERKEIDEIDKAMANLFERRMLAVKNIAEYKRKNSISVDDSKREEEIISRNSKYISSKELKKHYISFLKSTISISKNYQIELLNK